MLRREGRESEGLGLAYGTRFWHMENDSVRRRAMFCCLFTLAWYILFKQQSGPSLKKKTILRNIEQDGTNLLFAQVASLQAHARLFFSVVGHANQFNPGTA